MRGFITALACIGLLGCGASKSDGSVAPGPDVEPEVSVCTGEGCAGTVCTTDPGCLEGRCVWHLGQKQCSEECSDGDCPQGFACDEAGDNPAICVSQTPTLCRPCLDDTVCSVALGTPGKCIDYGSEGMFCASSCGDDTPCPAGYECDDGFCRSYTGSCGCSQASIDAGDHTTCFAASDAGHCAGERSCTADGLSPCSALTPAEDLCDGIDNNCDGDTDTMACDDGEICTADDCGGEQGCIFTPIEEQACSDGNACTENDTCTQGQCVGSDVDCDDNNPCTFDSCDPETGCQKIDSELCTCAEDSDCGPPENRCLGMVRCIMTPEKPFLHCWQDPATAVVCEVAEGPNQPCLESNCEPKTGLCIETAVADGDPCTLGLACWENDQCVGGSCQIGTALHCDDGDICTDDHCEKSVGCIFTLNNAACDDGDACTSNDQCDGGQCTAGAPLDCNTDDNPCTTTPCFPQVGCTSIPNDTYCQDGDPCTDGDWCQDGNCQSGGPTNCDDDNVCTSDLCQPDVGCAHLAVESLCDDGNVCTLGDSCVGTQCVGDGTLECDDNEVCTYDTCQPDTGCDFIPLSVPCNDGDVCTLNDLCTEGTCAAGLEKLLCDDGNECTDNDCDAVTGCFFEPNSAPCDDENPCTTNDTCDGVTGWCTVNEPKQCDDGEICTEDSCEAATGCTYKPAQGNCDDGDACTLGDQCTKGLCAPGPDMPDCDDGVLCTIDYCDAQVGCKNVTPINDANCCPYGVDENMECCPQLIADAGPNFSIHCGQSVHLAGTSVGGCGPYTYAWHAIEPIADTAEIDVAPTVSTSYLLVVKDAKGNVANDAATVQVYGADLNVCTWEPLDFIDLGGGIVPSAWHVVKDAKNPPYCESMTQWLNSGPSILLSDVFFDEGYLTGYFQVNDLGQDDDLIGFVFGYQNDQDFILFQWKQRNQAWGTEISHAGFNVKRMKSETPLLGLDFFTSNEYPPNVSVLYGPYGPVEPQVDWTGEDFKDHWGWEMFVYYQWTLHITGKQATITVFNVDDQTLVHEFEFTLPNDYVGGQIGFYNNSQRNVFYETFQFLDPLNPEAELSCSE